MEWYPEKLGVLPEGTTSTIEFLKANFARMILSPMQNSEFMKALPLLR
jgi:hypothetical protein